MVFQVSSIGKTDRHDIAELLLKVVLSTIRKPTYVIWRCLFSYWYIRCYIYVKNIAISSDPHSHFHCHACISYLSFIIFFPWSVIGVVRVSSAVRRQRNLGLRLGYFFYYRDPRFMSLIDSPWFVKFSKMANFNFRDLDFFLFSEIRHQKPPLLLKFSSMEKVFKIDLNLQH